jgi:hypothetical protein
MLSTELYIITPFTRKQMSIVGKCIDYVDPEYNPYQVFAFESRMQHFLERFFLKHSKYKYDHFVYIDVPNQGLMITTIQLRDVHDEPIEIENEIIRALNLEITNITTLYPNYCLFYSEHSTKLSRPWIRAILPSLVFERTVYEFFKEPENILIPNIVENGNIYLDLSDDINYEEVIQRLSSEINKTFEDFFSRGTLPEMLTTIECVNNKAYLGNLCRIIDDEALYQRQPGQFVHYEEMNGEEVMEVLAGLPSIQIPNTDRITTDILGSKEKGYATVYVVNFHSSELDLTKDQIGTEFLVSLKKFLNADAIVCKEVSPGYFEIYVNKNGEYIESAINIKEMFGYQFFTHHPIGLLVAQDMGLISEMKLIYDSYHQIGGVFVPMVYLGDNLQIELLQIQLYNRIQNVDAYIYSSRLEKEIAKHQLKIVAKIDKYIFVEKSSLITKRIIYRSLVNENAEMLIVGDWNFLKMSSNYLTSLADQLLKEHKITKQPNVRVGPFSSLIVPVLPRLAMERFIQLIDLHVKQKYEGQNL